MIESPLFVSANPSDKPSLSSSTIYSLAGLLFIASLAGCHRSTSDLDWAVGTWHGTRTAADDGQRSEEHTSELQSPCNLVCRLLLEKKKKQRITDFSRDLTSVTPLTAATSH